MMGCDVLRISAFKFFQHRDTETQRIIINGELYGNYMWIRKEEMINILIRKG